MDTTKIYIYITKKKVFNINRTWVGRILKNIRGTMKAWLPKALFSFSFPPPSFLFLLPTSPPLCPSFSFWKHFTNCSWDGACDERGRCREDTAPQGTNRGGWMSGELSLEAKAGGTWWSPLSFHRISPPKGPLLYPLPTMRL